jgi:outer membrane biosynthesis protein TonB
VLQYLSRGLETINRSTTGMSPRLRIGLIISAVLHVAILLVLLLGLPVSPPKDEEVPEATVAVVFQGEVGPSVRAPNPASVPAPAKEAAPPAPPVTEPPKPQPPEPPPPPQPQVEPPPTPPPPTPQPPQPHVETRPTPPPLPPPPPVPTPEPNPVKPPPPAPPPKPTPPAPTPPKVEPPLPMPPPRVPAPPSPPSTTSQPNPTKNPAPDSTAVDNTLARLRQQLAQSAPPKARPNPQSGGQPNSGGNPNGDITATLTASERGAIGEHVRECWTKDAGALDIEKQHVLLTVTIDASGMARLAEIAGEDIGRMGDPRFRAFAERARRAVLDSRCANLPLPGKDLGKVGKLTFRFSP